ncbi:unnamed protein product [Phytophthora fragariaefolia]|uniref:Unnamed protein product n=1 Tax=Phytophthora fragariaefolia TaxID=1490495 RepID=A0A9W7D2D2_9STRA|nr:unnamed protein product [Phytophthora fragariaefolia]
MVLLIKIPKEFQVTKLEQAFNIPATTMSPPPTLQAVKYVLLLPKLLDQCIQEPQYAKVTRRMRSGVTLCGIGSERERKWKITIEQALAWAVSADEVETNPSPLIRSPVVIIKDGHFIHGQVAACNGEGVVVNTVGGIHRVTQSSVVRSTPVVTILLRNLSFAAEDWNLTEIADLHHKLLDRILGTNGATATNHVQQIMHGIIDDVMPPSTDEIVTRINPLSGQEVAFPVQHAVDYAFYNVTLEEYRTQISQATLVPGEFKKKFSLENSSLQHILQTVSSRQLQRLRNEITLSSRAPKGGQEQLNNDSAGKQVAH